MRKPVRGEGGRLFNADAAGRPFDEQVARVGNDALAERAPSRNDGDF